VDAVCRDFESAPLEEREKALFRYLAVVNDAPAETSRAAADEARAAGLTDEELFDGVTVCALFNFYNRWIDGTGVPDVPDDWFAKHLEASGDRGYAP
jgi:alkylhydroperoxidase family enzyme